MAGVDLRYEPHLGLALGGGGALGAAHAGVLEVLHERGIVPTIVVGTSAGSIAGGAYANGRDPYEFTELVTQASWGDFGTFSMTPGLGLLDTEGLRDTVDRIGHDSMIEDLPIRFAAVATDLGSEESVLIDHGSLVEAIGASIAVPGLFRPKQLDGRTFVDGGVIQNLPLEQDLDHAKMGAVRGGSVFVNSGINAITGGGGVSFASPNTIVAPVTQVDASTRTNVDMKTVSNMLNNVGGIVQALQH